MPVQWMWLDWVFVALLALSTIVAWFRGFIREAISLISWIAALLLALHFAAVTGVKFFKMVQNPTMQFGVGFLVVFFGVLIIGMVVNFIIGTIIKSTGLGFFDAFLGAIFGFIRGGCIALIAIMFLAMPWMGLGALLDRSVIAYAMHPAVNWAMEHVPSEQDLSNQIQSAIPTIEGAAKNVS